MDGIHGATFSSHELKSGQSRGVVQVGSPFTQKLVVDLLEEAAALGLVAGVNDSGAGGLSSSAGELARITGGAIIDTSRVPLKYPGLVPWQIFLSESQERMTLAIRPSDLDAFMALAARRGVEAADIGEFTSSGKLEVVHGRTNVARLDLTFLHDGVPKLSLEATVTPPRRTSSLPYGGDLGALLLRALAHPNVASREAVVRAYDHEVKGKTVLKPYMGNRGKAPQDAGCMLVRHGAHDGIAVSSGIVPRYGDLDAYAMAQSAFDEAVRALVSIGARLPQDASGPFEAFAGCDNFCVPDSVFHPERNPDGREKLGKLVRIAEGLADMVRAFEIPMISGKDSMKNDFRSGGRKISVPPTLLVTMVAKIRDVRRLVTSEWKAEGDVVYLLGETYDELGRSIVAELGGDLGGTAPRVRIPETLALYGQMARAHDAGLLASSHDLSDGGLAVALAESCIGSGLGAELHLPDTGLDAYAALFSESNARFVVSVRPSDADAVEALFGDRATRLGHVRGERLLVSAKSGTLVDLPVSSLADAYETRLS
jgi:phosphoribosylformylglycinamidine synthase II